jgi:hemerythrin-like domain-containing protein
MDAIATIQDEHRTLGAVLQGIRYLVHEVDEGRIEPDFQLLGAMLYYLDTFPERFHHPREDRYLFAAVRARSGQAAPVLARLETDHAVNGERMRELAHALGRWRDGGPGEFAAFRDAVEAYAQFQWKHMRAEEDELLPLAREALNADDWKAIDEGFSEVTDPLQGLRGGDYDALFRRIVTLAPPPIGVGPSARKA